ncbi:MAG: ornithine carbamoyltransferase [Acidimicrobiia bacterium]
MSADFLMVDDLRPEGLRSVLGLAAAVKETPAEYGGRLDGARVGLFFEKPSTRTRVSSEVACVDLGAHPVVLKNEEVGLGKREAVEDVARVLDRYLDVLAFRVFDHGNLVSVAASAQAPVINLLSDRSHPCQALADLQTVAEHFDPIAGTTLTYVGDGNNVAHSLLIGGAMSGMHIRVACPDGFEPARDIVDRALAIANGTGGSVEVGHDAAGLVAGSDVVYTDVWTSMGQEGESAERKALFAPYRVDGRLFEAAGDAAIFLHCLPAHRGEEVAHEVIEHERSFVFDQAENRMHAFKALLLHLTGTA